MTPRTHRAQITMTGCYFVQSRRWHQEYGTSRASFYENSKVKSVRSIRGDSDKGPGMSLEKIQVAL